MDKKIRTGLQSKISHIFAGVPMPRKKVPLSEKTGSEKKDETLDLTQNLQSEVVIEEPVIEKAAVEQSKVRTGQEDDLIEVSLIDEAEVQQPQNLESKAIENKIEPELPKPAAKSPVVQKPEVELAGEEFSIVQEQKAEKPLIEKPVLSTKIREPIVEKPAPASVQKLEVQNTFSVQKPPAGKITRMEAGRKKDVILSKKISVKSSGKSLKSKPGANQSRQKAMVVIFIVFFILLVILIGKQFGFFSSNSGQSGHIDQPVPPVIVSKNAGSITIDWKRPPVYEASRDPMVLGPEVIDPGRSFIVNGISRVDGESLVLVGTVNYKLGSKIQGYDAEIINITESNVEFKNSDGITWTQAVGEKKTN